MLGDCSLQLHAGDDSDDDEDDDAGDDNDGDRHLSW